MTRKQTAVVMEILKTAYPRFYAGPDAPDMVQTLNLWAEMFQHDDVALVAAAVKALIESDEKGFPPHIGAVKGKIRLLVGREELTESEAWGMVAKALRNSTYGAKEEFEKLPPAIRRIVGSPAQLREWGQMDSETVHSVVASNFQRSYKAIAQKEREIGKLPPDVREMVQSLQAPQGVEPLPEKGPGPLPPASPERSAPPPREKLKAALSPSTGRSRGEVLAALKGGG